MSIKSNKNNLNKKYNCHQAQKEEIQSVYALARKYLGENIASLDKMLLWHDRNPEMFNVVYRISGSGLNKLIKPDHLFSMVFEFPLPGLYND